MKSFVIKPATGPIIRFALPEFLRGGGVAGQTHVTRRTIKNQKVNRLKTESSYEIDSFLRIADSADLIRV